MRSVRATTFLEGLTFGEAPRWHGGRLWYSDFFAHTVSSVAADGTGRTREIAVPGRPSGLGWLPGGELLVVSMQDRTVLQRRDDGSVHVHADLSALAAASLNDMLVLSDGTAFVGQFGFDLDAFFNGDAAPETTSLLRVDRDGTAHEAARDLSFPNGMVLIAGTLVVAETFAARLSAFDVGAGGVLTGRREWAALGQCFPDGICADAQGAIWVANALAPECLRVAQGGEVLARVETSQPCFACTLGGDDERLLWCCTAPTSESDRLIGRALARIEVAPVDIPATSLR